MSGGGMQLLLILISLTIVTPRHDAHHTQPEANAAHAMSSSNIHKKKLYASRSIQEATNSPAQRNSQAVALAGQALAALVGRNTIRDVTVQGTANYIAGSDQESGTATFEAHAGHETRIILTLTGGQRSEVRNRSGAAPAGKTAGPDGSWHPMAAHNCWTDETWFFPALILQSALADSQMSFSYVGQESKETMNVQHIRLSRLVPDQMASAASIIQSLSQLDLYLDPATNLPIAIDFNVHPDRNLLTNIPVEIQFSGWQSVNGLQVPAQIEKLVQGSLTLTISELTVSLNTGVPQSDFTI